MRHKIRMNLEKMLSDVDPIWREFVSAKPGDITLPIVDLSTEKDIGICSAMYVGNERQAAIVRAVVFDRTIPNAWEMEVEAIVMMADGLFENEPKLLKVGTPYRTGLDTLEIEKLKRAGFDSFDLKRKRRKALKGTIVELTRKNWERNRQLKNSLY